MASSTPLLFTMKARHRVLAAISWGERATKATFIDRLKGTNQQHDLDLSCFVFNAAGDYIDYVGSMAQDSMDQSGAIYHSGDDATGAGLGDDEAISCELAKLPDDVAHLVFVVEIRSAHVFSQVQQPEFRIGDGMTDNNLYTLAIAQSQGKDKTACVVARVSRDAQSPTGWALTPLDQYPDMDAVADWGSYLAARL